MHASRLCALSALLLLAGTLPVKTPREVGGTPNSTRGLPRLTEIFEARKPRDPAVMAEVAGKVRLGEKRRGKRSILLQPVDESGKRRKSVWRQALL